MRTVLHWNSPAAKNRLALQADALCRDGDRVQSRCPVESFAPSAPRGLYFVDRLSQTVGQIAPVQYGALVASWGLARDSAYERPARLLIVLRPQDATSLPEVGLHSAIAGVEETRELAEVVVLRSIEIFVYPGRRFTNGAILLGRVDVRGGHDPGHHGKVYSRRK